MSPVGEFYEAVRRHMRRMGNDSRLWLHPDGWESLLEGLGPPRFVREEQARAHHGYLPPRPQTLADGADVGLFEGKPIHIDRAIPAGRAQVRCGGERLVEIPAGPFPPAVEPEGGWPQPLYLPR